MTGWADRAYVQVTDTLHVRDRIHRKVIHQQDSGRGSKCSNVIIVVCETFVGKAGIQVVSSVDFDV